MQTLYSPGVRSRAILWLIAVFLIITLVWSFLGSLAVVSTVRGRIVNEGQMKVVQSALPGVVKSIKVREGDFVRAGQVLIELDTAFLQANLDLTLEKVTNIQSDLIRIAAEQDGKSFQLQGNSELAIRYQEAYRAKKEVFAQKKAELQAAHEGRKVALASGLDLIKSIERRLSIASERELRARPYVNVAVPRFQYLQWQDEVASLEKDLTLQQGLNRRLMHEIEESSQKLLQISSQQQQELKSEAIEKQLSLRQLKIELDVAKKRLADATIHAPVDGVIQKIEPTTVGENINVNDVLIQIVPANSKLELQILIPNEEMGYIRIGHSVDVKFDAFPFQKYGRMTGAITWLSPDAELTTSTNFSLLNQAAVLRMVGQSSPQYFYRGTVELDLSSNRIFQISPGMTAQADINTDSRRIIDFILFPTRKWIEEGLQVR